MQQTAGLTTATCMNMHFIEHVFVSLFYGNKKTFVFIICIWIGIVDSFGNAKESEWVGERKRVSEL